MDNDSLHLGKKVENMAVWFSRTIYFNHLPLSPSLKIIGNSKKWKRGERGGGGPSTQHLDQLISAAFRVKKMACGPQPTIFETGNTLVIIGLQELSSSQFFMHKSYWKPSLM